MKKYVLFLLMATSLFSYSGFAPKKVKMGNYDHSETYILCAEGYKIVNLHYSRSSNMIQLLDTKGKPIKCNEAKEKK